jgi:hypothetical protein
VKKETVDLTTQQIEDAISALDPGVRAAVIGRPDGRRGTAGQRPRRPLTPISGVGGQISGWLSAGGSGLSLLAHVGEGVEVLVGGPARSRYDPVACRSTRVRQLPKEVSASMATTRPS